MMFVHGMPWWKQQEEDGTKRRRSRRKKRNKDSTSPKKGSRVCQQMQEAEELRWKAAPIVTRLRGQALDAAAIQAIATGMFDNVQKATTALHKSFDKWIGQTIDRWLVSRLIYCLAWYHRDFAKGRFPMLATGESVQMLTLIVRVMAEKVVDTGYELLVVVAGGPDAGRRFVLWVDPKNRYFLPIAAGFKQRGTMAWREDDTLVGLYLETNNLLVHGDGYTTLFNKNAQVVRRNRRILRVRHSHCPVDASMTCTSYDKTTAECRFAPRTPSRPPAPAAGPAPAPSDPGADPNPAGPPPA